MIYERKLPELWDSPVSELADTPSGMEASELKAVFDSNANEIKPRYNGLIDDLSGTGGALNIGASEIYPNDPSHANVQAKLEAVYGIAKNAVAGGIPDRSLSGMKLEAGAVSENELSQEVVGTFVKKSGAAMTGELILGDYPQNDMGAVPKNMLSNFSRIKNRVSTTYNQSIAAGASVTKKIPHGGRFVTVTNIISNPGFESDLTGWTTAGSTVEISTAHYKYGTKSLKTASANASGAFVYRDNVPIVNGHKYYLSAWCKNTSTDQTKLFQGMGGLWFLPNTDWTQYSKITTASASSVNLVVGYPPAAGDGLPSYIDGITLIDLTAAFGAGAEPTQAWCDANIPFGEGTYEVMVTPSALAYPDRARLFFKSGTTKGVRAVVEITRDTGGNYNYAASGSTYVNIGGTTGYSGPAWLANGSGQIFYSEGTGTDLAQFGCGSLGSWNFTMSVTVDDLYINLLITNTDTSARTLTAAVTAEVY